MREVVPQYLKPCPFCGCDLVARWKRANPSARCRTEDCAAGRMPAVNLDDPESIGMWNKRAPAKLVCMDQSLVDVMFDNLQKSSKVTEFSNQNWFLAGIVIAEQVHGATGEKK